MFRFGTEWRYFCEIRDGRDVPRALRSDRPRRRGLTASCGLRVGVWCAPLLRFVATRLVVVQAGWAAPEVRFQWGPRAYALGLTMPPLWGWDLLPASPDCWEEFPAAFLLGSSP